MKEGTDIMDKSLTSNYTLSAYNNNITPATNNYKRKRKKKKKIPWNFKTVCCTAFSYYMHFDCKNNVWSYI